MHIELTEQLWDLLNPEFDGHTGLSGEDGTSYTPSWHPIQGISIYPIMSFIPKDIGKTYQKVFVLQKEGLDKCFILQHLDSIEITDKNIFGYKDGKRYIIDGENVAILGERR